MALLNPLRAPSYKPPVMKTWHSQPELNHEHMNLQQLGPGWAVIPGSATVSSVIKEGVTWAECEPFMNMHSCTWRAGTFAYRVGGEKEEEEERKAGTYLMTGVWRL